MGDGQTSRALQEQSFDNCSDFFKISYKLFLFLLNSKLNPSFLIYHNSSYTLPLFNVDVGSEQISIRRLRLLAPTLPTAKFFSFFSFLELELNVPKTCPLQPFE